MREDFGGTIRSRIMYCIFSRIASSNSFLIFSFVSSDKSDFLLIGS